MKLRAEKLVKKYGVRTVVKGVSMEVEQGEIVGFLGPNGAGKTTSFYMITGQIKPNAGRIFLDEDDGTTVEVTTLPMYSGGERRRCEIARALAVDPKFILLDEPFAGVDPIAVEDIQYIIAKLKYRNIGVIITDHNVGETLAITDRAYLLYEGVILQAGTPEQLAADEDVRTKYLGSGFVLKRSKSVERARQEVEKEHHI